ncbi:hypothetical protein ACTAQI_00725 [Pseudarthrobacter sp. alpha12b]
MFRTSQPVPDHQFRGPESQREQRQPQHDGEPDHDAGPHHDGDPDDARQHLSRAHHPSCRTAVVRPGKPAAHTGTHPHGSA